MIPEKELNIPGYKILSRIGEGGMGKVYLAEDETLGRRVAIKMISRELEKVEEASTRFLGEAKAMAAVEHPHIVRIYTYGKSEGKAYFVMEYIEGESLDLRIKRLGKLPVDEALRILKQVVLALDDAWERKIIHRDIKPSNILLNQKNQVKLADFGMAKSTQIKDEKTLTSPIVFRGSPYYVSPERAKGDPVDFHGDIYSLGIVLYEMLVGERPFEGTTLMEVIGKHLRDPIPSIKKKQPGIPGQVQELIEWMTQKDPKNRPSSYAEIMEFLDSIPQTRETGETPVIPGIHPLFRNMRHANFVLWTAGFLVFVVITWILSKFFLVDKPGISTLTRDKKSFVVAVTPFYGPDENSRREGKVMTFLVKKAIREQLGKENAEVISREETLETVRSHDQARALGERLGATVVIWGETFTVREETEIQPYFTIIPIKKEAEKTQVETDFNIFDPFRGPDAGFQEKSVEPIVIEAEAPNQIELRKTTAKGIGGMVSLLAGIHALNRENNAPKALALLNQAPESSEALRYRAYALLGLGEKKQALKALNKAVLLDPGDAVSFALMGDLHMKAGKFQEAVKAYKAAAETGKPYTGKRAIYYDNKLYCKEVFTSKLYNRYKYRKKKETVTRYLLESDPLTGRVIARYCLPGVPESFTIRDNSIHIEYRYFYLKEKIIFANGKFDRPVFYGGDILLRWQSMWSGWALAANFMEQLETIQIPVAEFKLRSHRVFSDAPANLRELENSLEKAIIKDPTQPWHLFFLGQALWAQGQQQKAMKTWENIFSLKFPYIPYYEFSYMAYFFEHLGQTDRADQAYHEALKRRNQLPLPGEFSSLLERFINAPNIRKAAMLSKEDKDTDRAYLWLKRVRKLMGICPGDYLASLSWKKYFRLQGDPEKAGLETAVQKRAKAHPVNDLEAYAYSNYAIYLLSAASIAFLLVFILLVTKAARQVTLTNTRNINHREEIKKSHLLQMIARGLQTNKILWEFIPIITAFAGITILFVTHEKQLYYYILIALFLVFIYISRISKKWPIRKFIACFSIPARVVLGISLFFVIITSLAVLSAYKTTFVTYKLMGRSSEYLGHAVFVHDLENLLKEKNTDVVRYAAAVINHLAGNRDRAAELYQSLPRDPRAQKNLQALEQGHPVPPVPLTPGDISLAYHSVSWKTFFRHFNKNLESASFFHIVIYMTINMTVLFLSLLLLWGFLFIPAGKPGTPAPPKNKIRAWFSRVLFFLVPGTFDIRRGSPIRGWLVFTLFTFAVLTVLTLFPRMLNTGDTMLSGFEYIFPLPHSLAHGKDFMEFFKWEIFWQWPGAKIFWGAVILSAIISLTLHIARFRKICNS